MLWRLMLRSVRVPSLTINVIRNDMHGLLQFVAAVFSYLLSERLPVFACQGWLSSRDLAHCILGNKSKNGL